VASNPVVQLGSGTVSGLGTSNVTVNQSTQLLGINWNSLGNNHGEVLRFVQPSASAIALNRVVGSDPSQFLGSLVANGSVIIINPNGVFFGPNSQVNVNGLIASSLNMTNANFVNGQYQFSGASTNGPVRNEGQISSGPFGVYLLAPNVTNNGVITSPGGSIALAAGTTAYLSDRADGRGFLVEVTAPAGEALNLKSLIADGGQVSMIGRLVTQSGVVQANSVRQQNGTIELIASERVTLTAGSVTKAAGDTQGVSDGGSILVKSDLTSGQTTFQQGAVLDVSGGANGGNGGSAEVSGASVSLGGQFLGRALTGFAGGRFLIDPTTPVTTADFQSFTGSGASNITFQSPDGTDLMVSANYNLANVGALTSPTQIGTLQFISGNSLNFSSTTIQNGSNSGTGALNGWNIVATAQNKTTQAPVDIVLNNSTLSTSLGGSITLTATGNIKLAPDGGSTGFTTLRTFGGDITINAGQNLIAPFALQTNGQYAGIRLQGIGNLNITTGGDFLGGLEGAAPAGPGFYLANGTATVTVGRDLGSIYVPGTPNPNGPANGYATFMLGSGTLNLNTFQVVPGSQGIAHINVTAGRDIYLNNVQDFGAAEGFGRSAFSALTVNPANSATFTAQTGNIFLNPQDISLELNSTHVLPPSFTASAPNGSITIQNENLDFWPSAMGNVAFSAGNNIQGSIGSTGLATTVSLCQLCLNIPSTGNAQQPGSISFTTTTGDITTLKFDLFNSLVTNTVTIASGRDLTNVFFKTIPAPLLTDSAGNTLTDATGNPIPGAVISAARDINMTTPSSQFGVSGFTFVGTGTAKISAGRDLDLANSQGIIQRVSVSPTTDSNKGGLLDISVGRDLTMNQSRILTENGASIWIHGIGQDAAVGASGNPTIFNGLPVVSQGSTQAVSGGNAVVVDGNSVLNPNTGKPLVLTGSEPVITTTGLLLDHFPAQTLNGNAVVPVLYQAKPVLVNGMLVLIVGGQVTLVDARSVSIERPVGGQVLVGTNQNSFSDQTGILTERGGAIQIKSMGDVDVQLSRIASFGGGNISITSTAGDINAGSGGKDQVVNFVIDEGVKLDAQGNPVLNPITGQPEHVLFSAQVPGSGIFTFHPADPFPLNFPVFNPLSPFEKQVMLAQFLGHDVSTLLPQIPAAHDAWVAQYNQTFDQFIAPLKLGDVTLNAARDVVVPPAGIRGRLVTINAGRNLDLNGGTIEGRANVTAGGSVVGSLSSFVGSFTVNLGGLAGGTGGGGTLNLGSISGSVGTITPGSSVMAALATTSMTSSKAADDAKSSEPVGSAKTVADRSGKKSGQQAAIGSLRIKDKVRIKVETKPD
jgi:filamentous hemagglutinin family protein